MAAQQDRPFPMTAQRDPETMATEQLDESEYADPHADEHGHEDALSWLEAVRIALVALAAIGVWFHLLPTIHRVDLIGVIGVLIGGFPIFKEALENIAEKRMTMELSMAIAIIAAAAISEFFSALVITLFVLVAEILEDMTVSRGRRAIHDLLEGLPRSVTVRRAGSVQEVAAEAITVGDSVLVNPGGRMPVDGTVIAGHSFVDQARITGESLPVEKLPGAGVYAGTINQSGALEVRAERVGRDTSYGKIIDAVERAEHSRAPVQRLADRLAGYLVYFALGAAALTLLVTRDIHATISVVIVAGACGIAAGTPLAILGAIGRAAREGAIVKGGLFLETLGRVDTVIFDKTGTLTFGRPTVQAIFPVAGMSEMEVLDAGAFAERRSEHPLGQAIASFAREKERTIPEPERFEYLPGRGVLSSGNGETVLVGNRALMAMHRIVVPEHIVPGANALSTVYVAREGRFLGAIAIADAVRAEARLAIQSLERLGICSLLLTGDAAPIAREVAARVGITAVEADLLPEAKLARIKGLIASGRVVAMVGDGINDAPALAAANVGVAMGSGTDVARESADVVLLGNDLQKFAETLAMARWTRRVIWQNFVGTVAVDTVGIGLAAIGLLHPLLAAFVHVASEMTFILNSARLLPRRGGKFTRQPERATRSAGQAAP